MIDRSTNPQEGHSGPPGYYLLTIWAMFFPWSLLLPAALVTAWRNRRLPWVRFSLAAVIGGGVDISLSHHLGLRVVQVDYVRTQFPNSLENVQNNLRIGAGIIFH